MNTKPLVIINTVIFNDEEYLEQTNQNLEKIIQVDHNSKKITSFSQFKKYLIIDYRLTNNKLQISAIKKYLILSIPKL